MVRVFILIIFLAISALSEPVSTEEQLQAVEANFSFIVPSIPTGTTPLTSHIDRGAALTKIVEHQGLRVDFQEGPQGANWTLITARAAQLGDEKINFSAAPILMVDRFDRAGAGLAMNLSLGKAAAIYHSSQFGSLDQHFSTLTVAPKWPVAMQVSRFSSRGYKTLTRLGPVVKLNKTTKVSYGHGIGGSTNLLLVTGNIRF